MAQIVADELGIPIEDVTVEHGDTQGTPFGYGTYGSRSAAVGGVAVYNALQRIKEKATPDRGAHARGARRGHRLRGGQGVRGRRARHRKTIQEIAGAAAVAYDLPEGEEPFLDDTTYYDPPNCTFPFGTHIALVEVDAETGEVSLLRYVAVDDVGKVINPMIVDGQVHGGIAQGIAQALWEGGVYDENGQLADVEPPRLRDAEGGLLPAVRGRTHGDADRRQPARRQGRGGDGDDRLDAGGRERGRRRARTARNQRTSTCR